VFVSLRSIAVWSIVPNRSMSFHRGGGLDHLRMLFLLDPMLVDVKPPWLIDGKPPLILGK
jgi:hypothetical protein